MTNGGSLSAAIDAHNRFMTVGLPTMVPTGGFCADPMGFFRGLPHDAFLAALGGGGGGNFFEMASRACNTNPAISLFSAIPEGRKKVSSHGLSKKVTW